MKIGRLKEYRHELNGCQLDLLTDESETQINCGESIEIRVNAKWEMARIELSQNKYYAILENRVVIDLNGKNAKM